MKIVFLAAVASLLVLAESANEDKKKELLQKSKTLMDEYYKDVIKELQKLKASGKTYDAKEINSLSALISVEQFAKHSEEITELNKLKKELEKAGELKDFKIYDQGSPEVKKEVGQAFAELANKELAPRFVGAIVMGGTQVLTDMIRMMLTRYGEMPDSHKVAYAPVG